MSNSKGKKDISTTKKRKPAKQRYTNWKDKPLNLLIKHVQDKFCNPYIRERDKQMWGTCVSCNSQITEAGHRYNVGDFPGMRFRVDNIHGQETSCNRHKSGNIDKFDWGLEQRYGKEYVQNLRNEAEKYLRDGHRKMMRHDVIAIGETYKYLLNEEIWITDQSTFNEWREHVQFKMKK